MTPAEATAVAVYPGRQLCRRTAEFRSPEASLLVMRNEGRTEMAKIVVSENVSLDGVIQDPAGDEGFRLGGWVGRLKDREDVAKVTLDEALGADALLLGRRPALRPA